MPPSTEALARVRAGRNPLYAAFDEPDDAIALAPLLEAAGEERIATAVQALLAADDGIGVIARHLADMKALASVDDHELAGRVLRRIYGR